MTIDDFKKIKIVDEPGVYFFQKGNEILYIGKATSLKERVKSYFSNDLIKTRGMLLVDMVAKATTIKFKKTNSVLEALLLETELIKKNQPYYNTKEKDDKSYSYLYITDDDFPILKIIRGKDLEKIKENKIKENKKIGIDDVFGPFLSTIQLRSALKIVRKLFPYRDDKCIIGKNKPCFNYSIGLCPGTCIDAISKKDYSKQVNKIRIFMSGNTEKVLKILHKEMMTLAKEKRFEEAGKVKNNIYALNHINDISLINRENGINDVRIEAYDIAHIQGQGMVGVMVVMKNGEFQKYDYKKFIIRTVENANDPKALNEVLERRFKHSEWPIPNIIVVDGNKVQLAIAQRFLKNSVSVVKDDKHKAREVLNKEVLENNNVKEEEIVKINEEAHRFAIKYFRDKLRKDAFKR